MQLLHTANVLATLLLLTFRVEAAEACEVDLGGPVLPAYLCAEQKARDAATQVRTVFEATLATLPVRPEPGGPAVGREQLQLVQAKWLAHVEEHCRFVSQVPGEPGDWHIRDVYENSCLAREFTSRVNQLKVWRACFVEGGGQCMP